MIFSFCNSENLHSDIWSILEDKVPEGYKYPDLDFLKMLDPTLYGKDHILEKNSLTSQYWNNGDEFWPLLTSLVPQTYSIPDGVLLRRQLEIL